MPQLRATWQALALIALVAGTGLATSWVIAQEASREGARPADPGEAGWAVLEEKAGEGERCIVCKQQIYGKEVVEIRYRGRRFHVSADMLAQFEDDPLRYFAELQARSGLFDERAVGGGRIPTAGLVLGVYVVLGLLFAAACGSLAIGRGHAPLPWFFAGLAGNVAALFVLLLTPRGTVRRAATRTPAPCPDCGKAVHPAARRCPGCGTELQPSVEAESTRT